MKVRCINTRSLPISEDSYLTLDNVYKVIKEDKRSYKIIANNGMQVWYNKERFEIMKEDNKMEKTFREVIADIKEGEMWENRFKIVEFDGYGITVTKKDKTSTSYYMYFNDNSDKYTLQRQQYTFEEAFKAYEEGKEIESCISSDRFKKVDDCNWKFKKPFMDEYSEDMSNGIEIFSINEIRGRWYINN